MNGDVNMLCNQCGTKNSDYSPFCKKCGNELRNYSNQKYIENVNEDKKTTIRKTVIGIIIILIIFGISYFYGFFIKEKESQITISNSIYESGVWIYNVKTWNDKDGYFNISGNVNNLRQDDNSFFKIYVVFQDQNHKELEEFPQRTGNDDDELSPNESMTFTMSHKVNKPYKYIFLWVDYPR